MKHKVLIAYDGTEHALKAVEYAANIIKYAPENFEVTLFYVLPPLPIDYVEYGNLSFDDEREGLKYRKELLEELKRDIENQQEKIFQKALNLLNTYKISNVTCKMCHATSDVAGEIIKECNENLHKTVVLGRKGKSSLKDRLLGGTAEKVIRYLKNGTVWVVE